MKITIVDTKVHVVKEMTWELRGHIWCKQHIPGTVEWKEWR